jgi:peptidoglycan/LPS O-acetylase OafA/YrhL
MLSGYVLTLARHASRNPEAPQSVVGFVQKRAAVIYPPYVVTLFLGLGQLWWEGEALPKYYRLAAQGVLAQSFVPWLPENTVQVCEPQAAGRV